MPEPLRLTELAHREVAALLAAGDIAVDATAGNGHDTRFLCETVGPGGTVYALDVQDCALNETRNRLAVAGLLTRAVLIRAGHERLCAALPAAVRGRVTAVMFNLGYLPGGDRSLTTRETTTIAALAEAVRCLRPGGILTVIAYRAHPGGEREAGAVRRWLRDQAALCGTLQETASAGTSGPVLFVARISGPTAGSGPLRADG